MANALKYVFVFVLFSSLALAGQVWKVPTFGPIEAAPVFFDDKIAIASYDGTIYYLYAQSGTIFKKAQVDTKVSHLAIGSGLIAAASTNKLLILDKNANILHSFNDTAIIYGMAAGTNIYLTTSKGLKAINYEGNTLWIVPQRSENALSPPLLLNDRIIYVDGDQLVVVNLDGSERQRLHVANSWYSRPAYGAGLVFVGSTDGRLYAVDLTRNATKWFYQTDGWVMSNPLYNRGTVFFGSNDGYLYAIDVNSGRLMWKKKVGGAIQGDLKLIELGGKEIIIAGSNDNRVYGFDTNKGEIIFAYSTGGWVHNPTFKNGLLYFGSYDGSFYAYNLDRACSIDSPTPDENVGYKLFNVTGRVFSRNSGAKVSVRINNGSWMPAIVTGNDWSLEVNPNDYDFGEMLIECKVSDSAGEERGSFTYLVLLRDINEKKGIMKVEAPSSVTQGREFTVRAFDENGMPLDRFEVVIAEQIFEGYNGSVNITLNLEPKQYNMVVRKIGYEDWKSSLNVNYDLLLIGAVILVILGILGAAFYLFVYKKKS